ncbi:MAG: hypothetical protein WCL18_02785 [bacterium]
MNTQCEQDFIGLANQIRSLEEKKIFEDIDSIDIFDSGTTYASEKLKLKNQIDATVESYKSSINKITIDFNKQYTDFVVSYLQYAETNKDLLKGIKDKITKVQGIVAAFSGMEATINKINTKITGLDDVIKKMEDAKTQGLANLDKTMQ